MAAAGRFSRHDRGTSAQQNDEQHPDTITKVVNYEGDMKMETFKGAAHIFSHANPEQFLMPLNLAGQRSATRFPLTRFC
jgi:hypothetical protein